MNLIETLLYIMFQDGRNAELICDIGRKVNDYDYDYDFVFRFLFLNLYLFVSRFPVFRFLERNTRIL